MIKSHVAKPNNIGQNNFKGDKGITDLKSALQEYGLKRRGSNPIDVTDPDWHLYLLIQKKEHKEEPLYQIVGFTAVYKFYRYPDRLRMRLSQILVLPSFQGKGFGSYLVEVVNKVATAENVYDLTVEEPSEKFQHIRTCIDINRLRAFDPIKPAIDSAVETLTKGKLSKKAQIPRFTPPLNAIDKVRETLKINKKHFLKCWEILIYLALDPIDKYLDDYTSVITNHVRAGILGKDIEAPKKQVVDVPTSYAAEASFVVFKSLSGEANNGNDVQVDENKPDQEEQLKQLVEERIREIKLVAGKVSKLRI
ncbi:histone acetyltransferase type B catalytic subunit-like isoform X1 [Brassica napus]|uniref:histone acetyltransferase type B catalytic subunit-like isoform X1 n=1 Tax=Brassica napus TaxID=3708 RepID=UPI000BBE70EB|nr:histone acetyltransferase type B catalytic subunit-like isoform X1 [Brassica napus]XP_048624867.1 histone acetyltransferase type B catalytic subunit-like isoform X1 [Brassica napus]